MGVINPMTGRGAEEEMAPIRKGEEELRAKAEKLLKTRECPSCHSVGTMEKIPGSWVCGAMGIPFPVDFKLGYCKGCKTDIYLGDEI